MLHMYYQIIIISSEKEESLVFIQFLIDLYCK
jgi:hypothetical protein